MQSPRENNELVVACVRVPITADLGVVTDSHTVMSRLDPRSVKRLGRRFDMDSEQVLDCIWEALEAIYDHADHPYVVVTELCGTLVAIAGGSGPDEECNHLLTCVEVLAASRITEKVFAPAELEGANA